MSLRGSFTIMLLSITAGCTIVPGSDLRMMWPGIGWNDEQRQDIQSALKFFEIDAGTPYLDIIRESHDNDASKDERTALEDILEYEYKVGIGDVLAITIWDHPELTIPAGGYRSLTETGTEVKSDGSIFYPYVGDIYVRGNSIQEVKLKLLAGLGKVIQDPQIDVKVVGYRSQKIYVTGAVREPGIQPVTSTPTTILDAIEGSGGVLESAVWDEVLLTRQGEVQTISLEAILTSGHMAHNKLLLGGDVLHIPYGVARQVFVLGEVSRSSSITLPRHGVSVSLAQAIAQSGGIREGKADGRHIYVLRSIGLVEDTMPYPVYAGEVYKINLANALNYLYAEEFKLKPRDIVYVSPAPITKWNRFLQQLIPSLATVENVQDIEAR